MTPSISSKFVMGSLSVLLIFVSLSGCAQTTVSQPNQIQAASQNPAPPPPTSLQPPSYPSSSQGAPGQFEQPPVVDITELLALGMQSGAGFHVGQQVTTNGAMGQYTIVADADVFHNDAGTYRVESLDLLKIRLAEIPAIAQLDNVSNTAVFTKADEQGPPHGGLINANRPSLACPNSDMKTL